MAIQSFGGGNPGLGRGFGNSDIETNTSFSDPWNTGSGCQGDPMQQFELALEALEQFLPALIPFLQMMSGGNPSSLFGGGSGMNPVGGSGGSSGCTCGRQQSAQQPFAEPDDAWRTQDSSGQRGGGGTGSLAAAQAQREPEPQPQRSSTADDPKRKSSPTGGPEKATGVTGASTDANEYTRAQLDQDLEAVLRERSPIHSDRPLGNPEAYSKWTEEQKDSLYTGILATHQNFHSNIPLKDYARLVLSEAAQESTGQPGLNVGKGGSQGLLQVTDSTVVADYQRFGKPVEYDGKTIIHPNKEPDLSDPAQNIALWGWYTSEAARTGVSADEASQGLTRSDPKPPDDYKSALFAWLEGPGRNYETGESAFFQDYQARMKDYWVQAGFGSAEDFDRLLTTPGAH